MAFYGVLLYWIPDVPAHYGNLPMWLSIIIYLIFVFYLAGFWALFGLSFATIRQAFPATAYLLAPFLWISFEYAMTYVLTGFPWGILGYSYEVIFPDLVRRFTKEGADFLVTITNDGWYGRTSAPLQHFAIAIFRAVENRRFMLRAATTGVSGIIDPYGRVLAESKLMTRTYLTERVTPSRKMTFYTEHGDILAWVSLTLSIIFFIMSIFKQTREREHYGRKRTII